MNKWRRFGDSPGPSDTSMLVDGRGWDYDGLITIEGDHLVIRRRDDEDDRVQRVPIDDIEWLLAGVEDDSVPTPPRSRGRRMVDRLRHWWRRLTKSV